MTLQKTHMAESKENLSILASKTHPIPFGYDVYDLEWLIADSHPTVHEPVPQHPKRPGYILPAQPRAREDSINSMASDRRR